MPCNRTLPKLLNDHLKNFVVKCFRIAGKPSDIYRGVVNNHVSGLKRSVDSMAYIATVRQSLNAVTQTSKKKIITFNQCALAKNSFMYFIISILGRRSPYVLPDWRDTVKFFSQKIEVIYYI